MCIQTPLCRLVSHWSSYEYIEWKFYSVGKAVQSSEPEQEQIVWVIVLFYQRENAMRARTWLRNYISNYGTSTLYDTIYIYIYTHILCVRVFYYNLVLSIQSNDLMSRPTVWHEVTLLYKKIYMLWVFNFINPYEPSTKGVSIMICYMSRRSPHRNRMFYYKCILKQTFCCPLIFTAASIKDSTSCVIGSFLFNSEVYRFQPHLPARKQAGVCICVFISHWLDYDRDKSL